MGDVLSLIEKAQQSIDQDKALELEKKLREQRFTLEDFLDQLREFRSMGPMEDILGMLPGMNNSKLKNLKLDEKEIKRVEAIIQSMTREERTVPDILNSSRKKRIAKGSGTSVQDVNRLVRQFEQTQKMIQQLGGFGSKKGKRLRLPNLGLPPF